MKFIKMVITLSAGLVAVGCFKEPAVEQKEPRTIRSVVAQLSDVGEVITQIGQILPRSTTALGFRLDGQLVFRTDTGTEVKQGDVLATIDDTPAKNRVLSAEAELSSAQSDYKLAKIDVERQQTLFAKKVIVKVQVQEAQAKLQSAKARLDAAKVNLAVARDTLSYTELKAPHDGIIASVNANAGQVVGAGQTIVTLLTSTQRDAVFDVPEKLLTADIDSPKVEVTLLSNPAVKSTGVLREISPTADPVSRTYKVKFSLDNKSLDMPFGANVDGRLTLSAQPLFRIPATALTKKDGETAVFVFNTESSKLDYKVVEVDHYDSVNLFITEGISNGDVVVTAGVNKLRSGESVALENGANP